MLNIIKSVNNNMYKIFFFENNNRREKGVRDNRFRIFGISGKTAGTIDNNYF